MENKKERKPLKKSVKIALIVGAVLVLSGVSVYAIGSATGAFGEISQEEAKQIALGEVKGADEAHITKCQKDFDDGRAEYDIEIVFQGYEYDFEISAKDGTIFDRSREAIEGCLPSQRGGAGAGADAPSGMTDVVTPDTAGASSDIGLESAKSIALSEVPGAAPGNIVKVHQDYVDGRLEYDVDIRYKGYEYEFEIDGTTGEILAKDVDQMKHQHWD